jgi:SulP family sulfate permease
MTGRRHNPDAELVAQGIGNIAAPFFGGIAATGAIARTATNIRSGGRTPVAAVVHAMFVLAAMVLMAPLLGYLPMASLAALLMLVAWRMSEARHVVRVVRVAPRSDVMVLLLCLGLTVIFDMVVAVSVGVVLAALLFMRRMAEMATVRLVAEDHPALSRDLPEGVIVYEIGGPLFFGAAQKAAGALGAIRSDAHLVIFDMRGVPTMDATALVNLESTLDTLHRNRRYVVIAGVQEQPLHLMARAGWKHRPWLTVYRSFDDALALARTLSRSDFAAAATAPAVG